MCRKGGRDLVESTGEANDCVNMAAPTYNEVRDVALRLRELQLVHALARVPVDPAGMVGLCD